MLTKIKPHIDHSTKCPYCESGLKPTAILWQGMHICTETKCVQCNARLIENIRTGHAINWAYQVDLATRKIFGPDTGKDWLGEPLLRSLENPQSADISIKKEVFKEFDRVILLNCIDFLYGHCLLKLLNGQRHLDQQPDYGLVVIIQPFLRWMIPDGVAEIWTIDLPLKKGKLYYPGFNEFVQNELQRFSEVQISEAYSHPGQFDITRFTRVEKHDFDQNQVNVTFIWREDRLWCNPLLERRRILKKLRLTAAILWLQNWRIRKLFKRISLAIPEANFALAGLGKRTQFPEWIKDARVEKFDAATEKQTCQLYSDSRLVIGVHGSNMLLPSGHAGMVIDLMPKDRWGNFAQDISYQEVDPRMATFRYRYIPLKTDIATTAEISQLMLAKYSRFKSQMLQKNI